MSKYLARRPGVLTWNVMPGPPPLRLGTLICHKPFTEFVLAFMYDPQVSLDAMGADELRERISALAGEEVDAEILGVTDPYGEWASLREVETTGCVLVRPDRHVAWRSTRYTPDSARQLPAAIEQALGLAGR